MNKVYKHLFFDLDRTLWDFDTNNLKTFSRVFSTFKLAERGIKDLDAFLKVYHPINVTLWKQYRDHIITKETLNFRRFFDTLSTLGINDENLAREMGACYIQISPLQTALYPQTLETLDLLKEKYKMHIITNGFEEVQHIKIERAGLKPFFDRIITSERAGFNKPDNRIFAFALSETGAKAAESLVIGDDPEADIQGARLAGMDQIWVKHPPVKMSNEKATYEVAKLEDVLKILIPEKCLTVLQ